MKRLRLALLVILLVLVADQSLKFWVKTTMRKGDLGAIELVGEKFQLHFIENDGMAFGWQLNLGSLDSKLILTFFRIIAVSLIAIYLIGITRRGGRRGLIIAISLIFAGAMGNIIDSVFYGVLFEESTIGHGANVARFLPPEGGYGELFRGKVVDMLYFPLVEGYYPEWMPYLGGKHFMFFRPVFNLADAAISSGVFMILLFHRRYFPKKHKSSSQEVILPSTAEQSDPQASTERTTATTETASSNKAPKAKGGAPEKKPEPDDANVSPELAKLRAARKAFEELERNLRKSEDTPPPEEPSK